MGIEIFFYAVLVLALFAILDLMVGVSNDAVNFLNSSIGSRVAPRYVILAIASLGILAGVGFSQGMMEVARKGIFHPGLFTMPELIFLFLGVMLADVILLDLFNSLSLPTSTTVSIVFELLGAAVVVSIIKILQAGDGLATLSNYINSGKALLIIAGILLSVVVAFGFGAFSQVVSRLLFTFDYRSRLKRYGAIWGGIAMASITYFILVKGAKGTSFTPAETVTWIHENTLLILGVIFGVSAVILQVLLFLDFNILKPIVLIGTFALAMAFAANDLVNFIGVPMAGYHAYLEAGKLEDPHNGLMGGLANKVPSETFLLLAAGLVMVVTLWLSKKARGVTDTEVNLGHQDERQERFESTFLSRSIVRMFVVVFGFLWRLIPRPLQARLTNRMRPAALEEFDEGRPSFDLLRASVNLMVASAVISYATSYKLPLSTTYVTFMVAMGTSFADMAWGRESAVYRVTGVLTVIGGWFMTALLAFAISGAFAFLMYFTKGLGVALLLALVGYVLWRNHVRHTERSKSSEAEEVFNLQKVDDVRETVAITFEHMGQLIEEIRVSLDIALDGLFIQQLDVLRFEARRSKKIQRWANIITANIFKALRLLQLSSVDISYLYPQTARRLQKLADGHRDIVVRSYRHVDNHHKGLLNVQVRELKQIKAALVDILQDVESTLKKHETFSLDSVEEKDRAFRALAKRLNVAQIARIGDETSKTRLSILYYAIVGNSLMLSKQCLRLLHSFEELFPGEPAEAGRPRPVEFDLD